MGTYIKPPLKRNPSRVIIQAGTNDIRSSQDPQTIAKNIKDITINSKNGKERNTNIGHSCTLQQFKWERLSGKYIFRKTVRKSNSYVGHGNIKSRQHCNYGGIYLNTVDSKILANGFILSLSRQTRQRISREIDAFNEDTLATESNSKFTKNS